MKDLIKIQDLPDFAKVNEWLVGNCKEFKPGVWEKTWPGTNHFSFITFRVTPHGFGWWVIACTAPTADAALASGVNFGSAFALKEIVDLHDALFALRETEA